MATICVVGAGRMGSALARAFLKHEHVTHVWNRTPAKAEALAALGATVATSLDHAVAASDIVVVNVIDYGATDAHLRLPSTTGALKGKLLVRPWRRSPRITAPSNICSR
jgi:3-hydroxyisobutyrate dehydrogenase-like beta-hydroxyacid dehydrogenase